MCGSLLSCQFPADELNGATRPTIDVQLDETWTSRSLEYGELQLKNGGEEA
jgi:hypothetical protein